MEGNCEKWKCAWMKLYPEGSSCILHDPNPTKDLHEFKKALDEVQAAILSEKTINLDGVVFPSKWSMHQWKEDVAGKDSSICDRSISFREATFQGGVLFFHGWDFNGKTSFEFATFQEKVYFAQCGISGEISFSHATFQKDLLIREDVTFRQNLCFDNACFQNKVIIGGDVTISFLENVSFKGAKFLKEASFSNATFEKDVSFENTQFQGKASFFPGVKFEGEVSFHNGNFMKECSFNHANSTKRSALF